MVQAVRPKKEGAGRIQARHSRHACWSAGPHSNSISKEAAARRVGRRAGGLYPARSRAVRQAEKSAMAAEAFVAFGVCAGHARSHSPNSFGRNAVSALPDRWTSAPNSSPPTCGRRIGRCGRGCLSPLRLRGYLPCPGIEEAHKGSGGTRLPHPVPRPRGAGATATPGNADRGALEARARRHRRARALSWPRPRGAAAHP